MKLAVAAAVAACFLAGTAAQAARSPGAAGAGAVSPDILFTQGEFDSARAGYEAVPKSGPGYEEALRQLGTIALYENHLSEAETLLGNARARNPADLRCVGLLAETMNREGKFSEMAQMLRQVGRPERVAEFDLFGKATPYRTPGLRGPVDVPFEWTDPLPVVSVRVNNLEGLFLIDTGAPEMILDPQFAHDAHVEMTSGRSQGGAAGSKSAVPTFGRIARFDLPGVETDDVPAMILSTRGFSAAARNKRVAGVIGTEFLSQFRPTLDYVHDRLILEPRDAPARAARNIAEIPFWFVGDHSLLAPGRLDRAPKQLFFVDTGLPGYAFTAPDSTLRDAGIPVPTPQAPRSTVIGQPPTARFAIAQLSLGSLTQTNLTGVYGPFPPGLEKGLGVAVGGVVGHAFFHPYAVTFDFVRMKIDIRK